MRRDALLDWFARHKRDLPWRRTRDPYRVWISEAMLQQTTVAVVLPYYRRFLKLFPSVRALARADDDAVLAAWAGLGYYSRAKNLRRAAQQIVESHGGRFPKTLDDAQSLPGVGPYTARAVLSIAYGARYAVVDGNVKRVLSRWTARKTIEAPELQRLADALLDADRPGAWNEAVMELGATVCLPRAPACNACPVAESCRGRRNPHRYPEPRARPATRRVDVSAVLVTRIRGGREEALVARTRADPTLTPLFEFPHTGFAAPDGSASAPASMRARLLDRYGIDLDAEPRAPLARAAHAITTRRIRVSLFRGVLRRRARRSPDVRWIPLDGSRVAGLSIGAMTSKLRRGLTTPA